MLHESLHGHVGKPRQLIILVVFDISKLSSTALLAELLGFNFSHLGPFISVFPSDIWKNSPSLCEELIAHSLVLHHNRKDSHYLNIRRNQSKPQCSPMEFHNCLPQPPSLLQEEVVGFGEGGQKGARSRQTIALS